MATRDNRQRMIRTTALAAAVCAAVALGGDARADTPSQQSRSPRPESCQETLTLSHVPGRLAKVWIIGCE
jgi:hypothetical protein